jgi:hypothetical protein
MPQPAPARFDATARHALAVSLLAATGPTLTLVVLVASYALSAHACATGARWWITGCIVGSVLATLASAAVLARRVDPAEPSATRTLRPVMLGLQFFCVLVMAAFAVALNTAVGCD